MLFIPTTWRLNAITMDMVEIVTSSHSIHTPSLTYTNSQNSNLTNSENFCEANPQNIFNQNDIFMTIYTQF